MNIAMIMAAGSGTRVKSTNIPKQFIDINGKPLLYYSIKTFQDNPNINQILIITRNDYIDFVKNLCQSNSLNKVNNVIAGGDSRQESVYKGLLYLKSNNINDNDTILIHDGARPLISHEIINNNILATNEFGACLTSIPSSDTIINSFDGVYVTSLTNRKELFQEQTPQSFKFNVIYEAHQNALNQNILDSTDDVGLVIKNNHKVHLVMGSKFNFKITTNDDLEILNKIIK